MQTLQDFAGSLNDNASLQRLRDNLLEIPKLLQRNEQANNYFLGDVTVSGDCNYHFKFHLEGGGFFQTGVLVASAKTLLGALPVPLRCKWKRRVGDLTVEIPGVTSNMYQISADDVGTEICVEAQPADIDDSYHGTVFGKIGPFELDPGTRRSLDNALGFGRSRFVAAQSSRFQGDTPRASSRQDVAIHVNKEGARVAPLQGGAERPGKELCVEFSAEYPKVIIHPLDTLRFQLIMNESHIFNLIAQSRTARDLIALTIRCHHAKRFLSTDSILDALLPRAQTLAPGSTGSQRLSFGPPALRDRRLEICIIVERLTKELNRSMQQKEVVDKALRNTNNEKRDLQVQLMETISGFTEVIEGLQEQFSDNPVPSSSLVPAERLQEQLHDTRAQVRVAQAELQGMRRRLEKLQSARKVSEASGVSVACPGSADLVGQLQEERDVLQARLVELGKTGGIQQDHADQAYAQELKRMRQDVEGLHNHKEHLRQQLQDMDRERQELQENFLYVKTQLDTLQLKQSASSMDGVPQELQHHRQTLSNAGQERSRLAAHLEGLLREQEKEKAYHEQSLERIMQANARLTEERDRAGREVERLSQLYHSTVSQLPADLEATACPSLALALRSPVGPHVDHAELHRLRQQIGQVEDALKRKEQENESLKHRIRKLASA